DVGRGARSRDRDGGRGPPEERLTDRGPRGYFAGAAVPACASGFHVRRIGFTIAPRASSFADTRTRTTRPPITARTLCRFGLKTRRLLPVILRPTPPLLFARPRRVYM